MLLTKRSNILQLKDSNSLTFCKSLHALCKTFSTRQKTPGINMPQQFEFQLLSNRKRTALEGKMKSNKILSDVPEIIFLCPVSFFSSDMENLKIVFVSKAQIYLHLHVPVHKRKMKRNIYFRCKYDSYFRGQLIYIKQKNKKWFRRSNSTSISFPNTGVYRFHERIAFCVYNIVKKFIKFQ